MFKFFSSKIQSLFKKAPSKDLLELTESLFYEADFGSELTEELCSRMHKCRKPSEETLKEQVTSLLRDTLESLPVEQSPDQSFPRVSLILGTNGSGKTTTVAKLAHYYQSRLEKVMIIATDTFRAAGMTQMRYWAEKLHCGFVSGKPGGDAAAIAYDGITSALSRGYDRVLIDTSGRLHTHTHLLHELSKLVSVCNKVLAGSPHEKFMTVDATLGGNTVDQVRTFHEMIPLSGIILTKVDGSAKGGTLFRIAKQLKIPTKFVGYGESMGDLEEFHLERFLEKLFPT
ncbi:signal recognition particle-docking protein FtsY [Chlamydia gallinacea]|uniref:Signal recognition particle-docking protein FtsY n=2 Tax=Chlamydia gallinacea TaxID=1457153 RepID=A0A173DY76_9CHLA|nr:signal recognition particle-docking protein FtsY [Chlamydia gallinacea]EYE60822.1 signal recognition particle-docking protein FtsY [Bacteroides fragilis str. S6L5]ANG65863.1 signal recognition particle-docking protein FtsY [Chlamydia gallinacea 08-1274/3]AQT77082.1 signal recognition particle-docking protein FtsY [Chlamydia gallinacea]MBX6680419.1 signal recognition particle-docking protein FtsY [Chlamydia gallinacea]MBX6687459.1 signal recognition particle-docking protein FtsY [Chlamydia g